MLTNLLGAAACLFVGYVVLGMLVTAQTTAW